MKSEFAGFLPYLLLAVTLSASIRPLACAFAVRIMARDGDKGHRERLLMILYGDKGSLKEKAMSRLKQTRLLSGGKHRDTGHE